jgi:GxxExxY protein
MTENEIAKVVVDACYHIHTRLGPGLLESVYLRILEYELIKRGPTSNGKFPCPSVTTSLNSMRGSAPI